MENAIQSNLPLTKVVTVDEWAITEEIAEIVEVAEVSRETVSIIKKNLRRRR